jgi:acyl-CoA reductase-like NAD-dependent aldehyde dehydrogenase
MSARRIIVQRQVAEPFISRLSQKVAGLKVGDPNEHDTIIGPLINAQALETVRRRVDEAVAGGARVLAGGEAEGPCYQATLLTDVPAASELAREETFGPVATVYVVDSAKEAVAMANDTSYGLSAGILTSDPERGLALAEQLQSGIVHVNDQPVHDEPQMPFGGVKDSGWGRFGGTFAMDEFTEMQWVTVQSGTRPFPF